MEKKDALRYRFAAVLLNDGNGTVPGDLKGISEANSVAVDPHKWLYAPLEAGCALVRNPEALRDAFSYHPPYYHFADQAEPTIDYHEYGPQNSRGFRALKVWLALRQVGRAGYKEMISDDIQLLFLPHMCRHVKPLYLRWSRPSHSVKHRHLLRHCGAFVR